MDLKKIFIKNAKPTKVGGQAVLDGIMMKGEKKMALVMRLPDDSLYANIKKRRESGIWTKIPIIRGIGIFGGALIEGVRTIMNSADVLEKYEGDNALEDDKFTKWLNKKFGKDKAWNILIYFSVVFSLLFSVGLFIILPTAVVSIGKLLWDNHIFLNLVEGIVRMLIFLLYVILVSKVKEIKEVFRYHGAEHKTIHCYESGKELTVENCREFTTLHPRCGTSFLVFVLIISLITFSFLGWPNLFWRILSRLLLLPVIAGISYELLRWAGRSDNWLVKILSLPGIYLQKITTAEPSDKQLEVAIAALKASINEEGPLGEGLCDENGNLMNNAKLLITVGQKELVKSGIEQGEAKVQSELLYCHMKGINRSEIFKHWNDSIIASDIKKYGNFIRRKANREPLEYIIEKQEFMGMTFYVNESVLIPRHDTEVIVERTNKILEGLKSDTAFLSNRKTEEDKIKILDLCCGSGAIGISLAKMQEEKKEADQESNIVDLTLLDISKVALNVAKENAKKIGINAKFIQSDIFEALKSDEISNFHNQEKYDENKFHVIVSNPPYISMIELDSLMPEVRNYEPRLALDGGLDGLDFYRKIVKDTKDYLLPGGFLIFEIGHGQASDIKEMIDDEKIYSEIEIIYDLASKERGIIAKKKY